MLPPPDPNNDPRPDPDKSPLHGSNAPPHPHIRLAAAQLRHSSVFEARCLEEGLKLVDSDDLGTLTKQFGRILSKVIAEHPTWLPKVDHPLVLRILRAAESADSYHILGCIIDPGGTRSYFLDIPLGIAPLEPGRSAAFICGVPRALIDGIPDSHDKDTAHLSFRSVLDAEAFEGELSSLNRGDAGGLFTAVVNSRLVELERPLEPILGVERSATRDDSFCALLIRFPSGSAIIELFREPQTGACNFGDLRFLTPGTRPTQDFFYDDRTPEVVRDQLLADLSARELEPLDEYEWVQNAKQMFGQALERLFASAATEAPVFVEIKQLLATRNGTLVSNLVAEAALRRADKSFLVPSLGGDEMLRSPEPATLFYSLIPHESPTGGPTVAYRLSHLALPPCGGLEGIIEAMTKAPDRSILTEPVVAILGADLELEEEELPFLKLTAVIPLTFEPQSDTIEITTANAHVDRAPVIVLCAHTKGAHLVAINRTGSGLLNVIDDIIPLHFFAPNR